MPQDFNTSTAFAKYSSLGLTHTTGTTFTVPVGAYVSGTFSMNDPVICQGSITAYYDNYAEAAGPINLNGGITLSGTANLGSGTLTINNSSSITGGLLEASNVYIGSGGTGRFAHNAGTVQLAVGSNSGTLYLGYQASDKGTYTLGGGQLVTHNYLSSGGNEFVGYSGTGAFAQAGGTNGTSQLYLGYQPGSSGSYSLSGTALLSAASEYVGYDPAATAFFPANRRQQLGDRPCGRSRRPLSLARRHAGSRRHQ